MFDDDFFPARRTNVWRSYLQLFTIDNFLFHPSSTTTTTMAREFFVLVDEVRIDTHICCRHHARAMSIGCLSMDTLFAEFLPLLFLVIFVEQLIHVANTN